MSTFVFIKHRNNRLAVKKPDAVSLESVGARTGCGRDRLTLDRGGKAASTEMLETRCIIKGSTLASRRKIYYYKNSGTRVPYVPLKLVSALLKSG